MTRADAAAAALLRAIADDIDAGAAVVARFEVCDDARGQRLALEWGAPGDAPAASPAVPLAALSSSTPQCARCGCLPEMIPEDNGGGWYCGACDLAGP